MHKKLFVALAAIGVLTLAGCGQSSAPTYEDLTNFDGAKIADFSQGEAEEIFASDGWSNGDVFNAVWKKENLTYSGGQMHLSIKNGPAMDGDVEYPYTSGEARSHKLYGYGDFIVKMKPTNVVGTVSTFFTYTDKWNKTDGKENKHDEIDIEFLGKDTTKVQLNYFVGGKGGHEKLINLGFDASKDFHEYGFRWEENKISWVVDGKTVYQVTGNKDTLPSMPGRIMTSYWPHKGGDWSGNFAGPTNDTVDYQWIKSSAQSRYADGEEPIPPFDANVKWNEISAIDTEFSTWADYTITKDSETAHTVTYNEAGAWTQVVSEDAARYANHADTVKVTLKNNSANDVAARVDVKGTTSVSTGETSSTDCLNVKAYSNEAEVNTNLDWGGSSFTLPGNSEVTVVVNYDLTTTKGAAKALLFFLDSMQDAKVAHAGSSVTIKDIKFANLDGTAVVPDPKPEPQPQPQPSGDDWDDIDASDLTFGADKYYTINKVEGVSTVTYTQAGEYKNVAASITAAANEKDTVRVVLKNNKDAASIVRIDVQGEHTIVVGDNQNNDCLNTNAVAEGHSEMYTDPTWGGSKFTLKANEEVAVVVTFDQGTERGAAVNLLVFLDSLQSDAVAHEGDVSIKEVKFAKLGSDEPVQPDPQPSGDDPAEPEQFDENAVDLTFSSTDKYTVSPSGSAAKAFDVSYAELAGNCYANINSAYAGFEGKDSFTVSIKNNGSASARVRIDVNNASTAFLNTDATAVGGSDLYTDTTYGGTYITVAAGQSAVVTVEFDQSAEKGAAASVMFFFDSATYNDEATHSGNIHISNFIFAGEAQPSGDDPVQPDPQPGGDDPVQPEQFDENAVALSFDGNEAYTLSPKGTATKALDITYTDLVASYQTIWADYDGFEGKTTFALDIKNNGSETVKFRVDVEGTTEVTVGANEHNKCLNVSATCTNRDGIFTDETWGGSFVEVAADEKVTMTVTFDQTTAKGAATKIVLSADANRGSGTWSGNVHVSNFIFAGEAQQDNTVALSFDGNEAYSLNPKNTATKTLDVTYTDLVASYQTIWADYDGFEGKTTFSITIKNNGEETAKVRVDVEGTTAITVGDNTNNKCLNVSATCTNRDGVFTDATWGGSFVEVAADEEVTMTITFDQTTERGAGAKIVLSCDANRGSGTWSGNIHFSNFIFE